MFSLLATVVFGQSSQILIEGEPILTSEGWITFTMYYEGKNRGQRMADDASSSELLRSRFIYKLSNGKNEVIGYALSRYQHSAGDTYSLTLVTGNNLFNTTVTRVIIEFTTTTYYTWWAYLFLTPSDLYRSSSP
jgi:hypothetical protein